VNTASYWGHLEIVRLLLTLPGLDITTEDKWGDAPEASAREKGHTAIASLLREHASAAAAPAE
jgi:ankyrin repeat protein